MNVIAIVMMFVIVIVIVIVSWMTNDELMVKNNIFLIYY